MKSNEKQERKYAETQLDRQSNFRNFVAMKSYDRKKNHKKGSK